MRDLLTYYIDKPYFEIKCSLEGDNTIFIKWNIFNDKKDDNKLVMRTRYVLENKEGERKSLKTLNLTLPVDFKQIYIDENKLEILEFSQGHRDAEVFISAFFGSWINNEFQKMINSGDCKITSFETVKLIWKD